MEKAITRFAPSPTGYIHIGNVRSAIYPYLLARQTGGRFILRIEDTDRARYVEGATDLIEETLVWLGLNWDEGPEVGGPHGPYFQTERKELYIEWAKKLISLGLAYPDETPSETVDEYRKADAASKVPYLYRNHRPASAEAAPEENLAKWREGMPIRFKTTPKDYSWHDEVMGDLAAGPEVLDDIILIKKDGLPTYNFAHIVDDAEMGVTHVIRGQEYLSSMPNYLALYEALGLERPKFVSLPHILAPQGNKKLSKRDGAKSVTEYRDAGILPETMLNYLAGLGWNDGTEQEIYTREELIAKFSLDRVQNSGARFDETKLLWENGMWIRRIHDEEGNAALYAYTVGRDAASLAVIERYPDGGSLNFWPEAAMGYPEEYRMRVLDIIYDRLKSLGDLKAYTGYFFEEPEVDLEMIRGNKFLKKLSEGELRGLLATVSERLASEEDWTASRLQEVLNELLVETGKKPAELFGLVRLAISFAPFSPALPLTLEVLGKERTLARLNLVMCSCR